MSFTFVVRLEAMRFHARVGALAHEAEIAQSIEVDVAAWVNRDEAAHGAAGVLDYRRLYDVVSEVLNRGHIAYLEDLTSEVAARALELDGVLRVRVSARKPHVALPGPLAFAEVTLDRVRDG